MPLPRDRYPDITYKPDWRIIVLQKQVADARRVACEQYTRANKLERERDKLKEQLKTATWQWEEWKTASIELKRERDQEIDTCDKLYSRWAKAERENAELVKALKYYKSAGRIDIVEPADDCLCDYCMATRRIQAALVKVE